MRAGRLLAGIVLAGAAAAPPAMAEEALAPSASTPFAVQSAGAVGRGAVRLDLALQGARSYARTDSWEPSLGLRYGLADRLELRLDADHAFGNGASAWRGRVGPGLRWEAVSQAGWWPTLSVLAEAALPTGPGDVGTETLLALLASRTTGSGPGAWGLHLNAGWIARPDPGAEERRGGYRLGAAVSHVLDPRTLLVAAYVQETQDRGERDLRVVEAGLRRSLGAPAPDGVSLGFALGAGLNEDSPRLRGTVSLRWDFATGPR